MIGPVDYSARPDDMLQRQLKANRNAVRYRNPETGKRHYCHFKQFIKPFLKDICGLRAELRKRGLKGF